MQKKHKTQPDKDGLTLMGFLYVVLILFTFGSFCLCIRDKELHKDHVLTQCVQSGQALETCKDLVRALQ